MRLRPFHLALLAFQVLWLNVIVPGHTRGIVKLPGSPADAPQSCPMCDAAKAATPTKGTDGTKGKGDPVDGCAICFFAAHLATPPVIDLAPPPLGLAERLDPPAETQRPDCRPIGTHRSRAPPANA